MTKAPCKTRIHLFHLLYALVKGKTKGDKHMFPVCRDQVFRNRRRIVELVVDYEGMGGWGLRVRS